MFKLVAVSSLAAALLSGCGNNPPPAAPTTSGVPCQVYGVTVQNCPPDLLSKLPTTTSKAP